MAPTKAGHLLLQAFKAMKEPKGLTATQIIKFYSRMHEVSLQRAARVVGSALRTGLAAGFVGKRRKRFVLGTEEGDEEVMLPENDADDPSEYDLEARPTPRTHERRRRTADGRRQHRARFNTCYAPKSSRRRLFRTTRSRRRPEPEPEREQEMEPEQELETEQETEQEAETEFGSYDRRSRSRSSSH